MTGRVAILGNTMQAVADVPDGATVLVGGFGSAGEPVALIEVTVRPGASYFHHADSFAMMRGGHLDICVLGAYQVSAAGDLANWHTGQPGDIPAVGGAMDLAIGARQTFVMMTLLTRDGRPKLVPRCSYPLTGLACVSRVYTDLAVFLIEPGRVVVRDLFGVEFDELTSLLDIPLVDGTREAAS